MHEFGIAEALLQAALEEAKAQGALAIEQVHVQIGRLRRVVPEALNCAFAALAQGTLAEGAALVCEEIPPRVCCRACNANFQPEDDGVWVCPICGAAGEELLEGNESVLQRLVLKKDGGD
jgi:hydrogenase nickel incorporation protein HypA/HybF